MGVLTWRNVDAPDFTPALRGVETFSNLLNQGLGAARAGLNEYDSTLDKAANNAALMKFASIQDPNEAKAALAALSSMPGAGRLDAATIASVSGRPGALLQQAATEEANKWTGYQHTRTQGFDRAEDAFAPLVADRLAAYASGGAAGQAWDKAHADAFKGLSLADTTNLATGGQAATTTALSQTGQQIGNETARFGLTTSQEDRAYAGKAADFLSTFRNTGHGPDELDGDLARSGLPGRVQELIRAQLGVSGFGGASGGGAGGGGGGIPAPTGDMPTGDPTRIMNYEARGKGFAAVPDSVQTWGQFSNYASGLNKQGVKSSAAGLYQIVGDTAREFAPSVLGKDWQNKPYNAESQDKIAEAIFNQARNSSNPVKALTGRWSSLSPEKAAYIAKLPWEQARGYITKGESGVANPAQLLIGKTLADAGTNSQYSQQNANSIATAIAPVLRDTSSLSDVAGKITGSDGALKGARADWVANALQDIIAKANAAGFKNLSPAAAAIVLNKSLVGQTWGSSFLGNLNSNALTDKWQINPKAVDAAINEIKGADWQKVTVANATADQRKQLADNAKKIYDQALANYQSVMRRAQNNPAFDRALIGKAQLALEVASRNANVAIDTQGQAARENGGMGPYTPPAPAPAGAPAANRVSPMLQYYLGQQKRVGNGSLLLR